MRNGNFYQLSQNVYVKVGEKHIVGTTNADLCICQNFALVNLFTSGSAFVLTTK